MSGYSRQGDGPAGLSIDGEWVQTGRAAWAMPVKSVSPSRQDIKIGQSAGRLLSRTSVCRADPVDAGAPLADCAGKSTAPIPR